MIVNLPNWATIVAGVSPWTSNIITSFLPAVYWEIGLAIGVFIILFVIAVVSGGLKSLLGAFGHGSNPMSGIPGGNSGIGGFSGSSGRSFGGGRSGHVGIAKSVNGMSSSAGSRWSQKDRQYGLGATGFQAKKPTIQDKHAQFIAKEKAAGRYRLAE